MKRTLLAVATAMTVALIATSVRAQGTNATETVARADIQRGSGTPQTDTDGWRYRWHANRLWYWTPENKWLVWTGVSWASFEPYRDAVKNPEGSASSRVASYGSYGRQDASAPSLRNYRGATSWASPGVGAGGYAGYGWTWGPGIAYRNSPGARF